MQGDVPLLVMELAEPEGLHAAIDVTAGPLRLAGSIEAEHGPIESTLSMSRIVLRADLADAGWSGKVTAADIAPTVARTPWTVTIGCRTVQC